MAYNILKGKVQFVNSTSGSIESMVDDYSDQTIAGIKTFTNELTASGGFRGSVDVRSPSGIFTELTVSNKITHKGDTDTFIHLTDDDINIQAGGLNFIDITQDTVSEITFNEEGADIDFRVEGDSNTHLLYVNAGTNKVGIGGVPDHTLTVAGDISASVNISASAFYGAGTGLTGIAASSLTLGQSMQNSGGSLVAKLSSSSGLESTSLGLRVNPSLGFEKTSPANADTFLIADSAVGNKTKKITYQNLSTAITDSVTTLSTNGNAGAIQIKNGAVLLGPNELNFNTSTNTLTVTGNITGSTKIVSPSIHGTNFFGGGQNLTGVSVLNYTSSLTNFNVLAGHSLLGINSSGSAVTASFAVANSYQAGQTFTFKDIEGSGSINHIVIATSGGQKIDGNSLVKIKANYGAVSIATDGATGFFIVSTS